MCPRPSHLNKIASALFAILLLARASAQSPFTAGNTAILISSHASATEKLAGKELRRYIYLRTGEYLPLVNGSPVPGKNLILVADKDRDEVKKLSGEDLKNRLTSLKEQQYLIKSIAQDVNTTLLISGGDDFGTLYGAYRYIQTLGVRFYLHDDVVPEDRQALQLTNLDIAGKPLFALRGILPFHDFPQGPDWWSLDDYKAYLAQLPKMGMNFIGFHSYPEMQFEGRFKAEPMVWIGTKDQINPDGTVKAANPITHASTGDETWGTVPRKTSDFSCGAAEMFETDQYGAPYMQHLSPWPHTSEENIKLFNDFGALLHNTFTFARGLGIKTCIGTETPLSTPRNLWDKFYLDGKNPDTDAATKQEVYEGMFMRIMKSHPLDYYWFWTPEWWTWRPEARQADVITEMDMLNAVQAAQKVNATFTLATCGWVLGPNRDRAEFDKMLPKDMPFSCINQQFGFTPIDPGFKTLQDRPKWAIPWLEYDWPLVEGQLWAGRVRRDAMDAYNYGCNGLIGIHWRTQILSPQIGALAQAGWELGAWTNQPDPAARDLPIEDFYRDWATAQFGKGSDTIAKIFVSLDGGPRCDALKQIKSNMPRATAWGGEGPGLIMINPMPWSQMSTNYAFVDTLAALENQVQGAANKERFEYWLNTFRYMRAVAHTGCALGELETSMQTAAGEPDRAKQAQIINDTSIPLRKAAADRWAEMVTLLLSTVSTPGEMGTVASLELHSLAAARLLSRYDRGINIFAAKPVGPVDLGKDYRGPSRLIVPTKRTLLESNEDLNVKVIVLSHNRVKNVTLRWRTLGEKGEYQVVPATHIARGVYEAKLPAATIGGNDLDYYVQADLESETLRFPVSAPTLNHSVVVN